MGQQGTEVSGSASPSAHHCGGRACGWLAGEQAIFLGILDQVFQPQGTDLAAVAEACRTG
jgi:hypothetical protein